MPEVAVPAVSVPSELLARALAGEVGCEAGCVRRRVARTGFKVVLCRTCLKLPSDRVYAPMADFVPCFTGTTTTLINYAVSKAIPVAYVSVQGVAAAHTSSPSRLRYELMFDAPIVGTYVPRWFQDLLDVGAVLHRVGRAFGPRLDWPRVLTRACLDNAFLDPLAATLRLVLHPQLIGYVPGYGGGSWPAHEAQITISSAIYGLIAPTYPELLRDETQKKLTNHARRA